jgi:hypothetical protein
VLVRPWSATVLTSRRSRNLISSTSLFHFGHSYTSLLPTLCVDPTKGQPFDLAPDLLSGNRMYVFLQIPDTPLFLATPTNDVPWASLRVILIRMMPVVGMT